MEQFINYIGLALLIFSIFYFGRQINIYLRMKSRLGKLIYRISPGKMLQKIILSVGILFIVFLIYITYVNVKEGYGVNVVYTVLLAAVIFSFGRMIAQVVEIREKALLGNLNEIEYKDIKTLTYETIGKRLIIRIKLKDGRDFVTVGAISEKEEIIKQFQQVGVYK